MSSPTSPWVFSASRALRALHVHPFEFSHFASEAGESAEWFVATAGCEATFFLAGKRRRVDMCGPCVFFLDLS